MTSHRILWLDYARFFAILLVVVAHTPLYTPLVNIIYCFHVPLFFFISGSLFSFQRHPSFRGFALRRASQLLVPYLWMNLLTYAFWLLIGRKMGAGIEEDVAWYEPLKHALLVNGPEMIHNVPLWFLPCLFLTEMIFYVVCHRSEQRKWLAVGGFVVVGGAVSHFLSGSLPFSLGTALVAAAFYATGYYMRKQTMQLQPRWWGMLGAGFVVVTVGLFNGRINMHTNYYHHYLLFLVGAVAGIYGMLGLAKTLSSLQLPIKWMLVLSHRTIYICGFHLLVFAFLKGIMAYVFQLPPDILQQTVWPNLLFSTIATAVFLMKWPFGNRRMER
ncbi:MAG: acyltransferase family protein [Prevotella sp.]|nr:acyltransferase family protein [Prevotella sp.]